MKVTVFTARSTGIAIATAVIVTAWWRFIDVPWGLAVSNGWVTGGLGLLIPVARGLGRLRLTPRHPAVTPWQGVFMVGLVTLLAPISFFRISIEMDLVTGFALSVLIGLVGCVAWMCGDLVATLEHLKCGAPTADARTNRHDAAG